MTAQEFCYWLQGFCELGGTPPTPEQWRSIREHLALVFNKVTLPSTSPSFPDMPVYEPRWIVSSPGTPGWQPADLRPKCSVGHPPRETVHLNPRNMGWYGNP